MALTFKICYPTSYVMCRWLFDLPLRRIFQDHARRGLLEAISIVLLVIASIEKKKIFTATKILLYVLQKVYNINKICIPYQDFVLLIISRHKSKWFSHPGFIGVVLKQEWWTERSKYIMLKGCHAPHPILCGW
jgi:hypothetical protein